MDFNIFTKEIDKKRYLEIYCRKKHNLEIDNLKIYMSEICRYIYSKDRIDRISNFYEIELDRVSENIYYRIVEWNKLDLKFYFNYKLRDNALFNTKEFEINYLEFENSKKTWNDSIYFIMVDRYIENLDVGKWKNDDYYAGGGFKNIINDIPRICESGYTTIYLSPIFSSLSYHGYNQTSFENINNIFGGKEELLSLVNEIKKYNIKLGIEIVLNHFSVFSNEFRECLKGTNDLFYINDKFEYELYRDCIDLAKIKYSYENREIILNNIITLINTFNIKFIRLDCCDYLDRILVCKIAEYCIKESILLTGECWSDYNNFFNRYLVDGATNYRLYGYLKRLFIDKNIIVEEFQKLLIEDIFEQGLYRNNSMLNFLDNHDITRISNLIDDKNQLLSMIGFLFMYIGVPVIYYGTENYNEIIKNIDVNRRCFFSNNIDVDINEHIKMLNEIRKKFINDQVYFESKDELLIFSRDVVGGQVKYIYNNSSEEIVIYNKSIKGYSNIIINGD